MASISQLVAGVSSSFVDCISFFSILRFIVGFSLSGAMLTRYVYCMELVGPKQRTTAGILTGVYYLVSMILFTGIAYLIPDWRMLMFVGTIPAVLLFPFWR